MKLMVVIIGMVFFLSCSNKPNTNVLNKGDMASVLADLSIATEMVAMGKVSEDSSKIYYLSVYKPMILEKHNISLAHFDKSFAYYTKHPKEMVSLQSAIADTLRQMQIKGRVTF